MELIIKNQLKEDLHDKEYKLIVESMHGDAEGYTFNTLFIMKSEEDKLIKILEFLQWAKHDKTTLNEIEHQYGIIKNTVGLETLGFVDRDYSNGKKTIAKPSIYRLTYFDAFSIEHAVEIK